MATDACECVRGEVTATSPATSSKMFGMPCPKSDTGEAFTGFYQEAMAFKLGRVANGRRARFTRRTAF